MDTNGILEIERKFIVEPTMDKTRKVRTLYITQTYLITKDDSEERVREILENGKLTYRHNIKRPVTTTRGALVREEFERDITEDEYRKLVRDKGYSRIVKERSLFNNEDGKEISIDYFLVPEGLILMEIEYDSLEEEIKIPKDITIVKEVTEDKRYKNINMAINYEK